jgi:hypothetical protein
MLPRIPAFVACEAQEAPSELSDRSRGTAAQLPHQSFKRCRFHYLPRRPWGLRSAAQSGKVFVAREQRKLAATLAADVVGYSRLMGRDENGALAALVVSCGGLVERAANPLFFKTTSYERAAFPLQSGKRCPGGRSSTTLAQQHAPVLHPSMRHLQ